MGIEKMSQGSQIMGDFGMQGRLRGAVARTILELLKEEMDGSDDRLVRRKSLKERLGLIGCCGTSWRPSQTPEDEEVNINMEPTTPEIGSTPLLECFCETPGRSGMNLAAALAAERQYRAERPVGLSPGPSEGPIEPGSAGPGTPRRVSLMKLLEETDGCDEKEGKVVVGNDSVCCVCMVRKKGAAFIPCGHTFCRVCSRELWLNRGTCPLCNRSIFEILDIF